MKKNYLTAINKGLRLIKQAQWFDTIEVVVHKHYQFNNKTTYTRGWGNGYCVIPIDHPLHNVHYNHLDIISVHGGLTYSDFIRKGSWLKDMKTEGKNWIVGFDTAHADNTIHNWPKHRVQIETEKLKTQLILKAWDA